MTTLTIDRRELCYYLTATTETLLGTGQRYLVRESPVRQERGRVALVAHADHYDLGTTYCGDSGTIISSALDDRLGCYLSATIQRAMSCYPIDTIWTDDEEKGASTASRLPRDFLSRYCAFIELDRRGADVVTYDLDSPAFLDLLTNCGMEIGIGSYSDICRLDTDRCACNVGIGYHHEHSPGCYLDESELQEQYPKVIALIKKLLSRDAWVREARPRWGAGRGFAFSGGYGGGYGGRTPWPWDDDATASTAADDWRTRDTEEWQAWCAEQDARHAAQAADVARRGVVGGAAGASDERGGDRRRRRRRER